MKFYELREAVKKSQGHWSLTKKGQKKSGHLYLGEFFPRQMRREKKVDWILKVSNLLWGEDPLDTPVPFRYGRIRKIKRED